MEINLKKMMEEIERSEEVNKLNKKLTSGQQKFLSVVTPIAATAAHLYGLSLEESMEALYGLGLAAKERLNSK